MKYYFLIAFIGLGITSCKPKFEEPEMSAGEINPTRFVMVGGAHTAGYMDDALYFDGQENSLANLIAGQLEIVGGGSFYQPLVSANSVGVNLNGLSKLKLGYKTDCEGNTSLSPIRVASVGDLSIFNDNLFSTNNRFGNYGIPGMKLMNADSPNYSQSNSYFARMASTSAASVLGDATTADPTFFSLFLGVEDVLDFAKSGGTTNNLPTVGDFQNVFQNIIETLTSNGSKGVIATIPDVTEMPYFNTIPWNGLTLDAANTALLNSNFNPLFYYSEGSNPFLIVDSTANEFFQRQVQPNELMLLSLPLDSVKCNLMGVFVPIRDEFVLDQSEIQLLRTRLAQYNNAIISIANQYNLALVRVDEFCSNLKTGFTYNGVSMSAKFVSGGAYSIDGIHFNAKGNALLANEFIKSINLNYKSRIPQLNSNAFNATLFP